MARLKHQKQKMNYQRTALLAGVGGVVAISLLWLALFVSPDLYHRSDYHIPVAHQNWSMSQNVPQQPAGIATTADKFTPEVLLSAPRRSAAKPNADGSLALYTVSTYSFESHMHTNEIRILDFSTNQSTLVTNAEKTSEPHWLEDEILYLKEGPRGSTQLVVVDGSDITKSYIAGSASGPISDLKLKVLEPGKVAFVCTGKATREGALYNAENEPKKFYTGMVYDSLMVRHWDQYVTSNRNSLWYGVLQQSKPHITESKGRYNLTGPLINALKGGHLESPIPPFASASHYDISAKGIAFVAKDPTLDPAFNTKCNFYYLPLSNFTSSPSSGPKKVQVEGFEGAASSPVLMPNGQGAAFLQMKVNGYESDKNRVIIIPDLSHPDAATEAMKSSDGAGVWDRSPSDILWSLDGRALFLLATENGRGVLWKVDVPATPTDMNKVPQAIAHGGMIIDVVPLSTPGGHLFFSGNSFVDNSFFGILDPAVPSSQRILSSNSRNGSAFGLSADQVSEIWFKGAGEQKVHAWVVKPSFLKPGEKAPLAYLIHGGPQAAWEDEWSTRWNAAVYSEAGYVVVMPNPTGSSSYGQAFVDAIQNNWGSLPYDDLVAGFDYVEANLDFADTRRAVGLGASFGGYMVNWINGHELGRRFRALVCHDGVFSMTNQLSSDEQYFPVHDLGGPAWKVPQNWERWDPSRYTEAWATPQLVIHNARDYRLPISEGLAAFNVLQGRGIASRFLTFPDENHWVLRPENSRMWHTVVLNWINRFVDLPFTPDEELDFEVQSSDWETRKGVA